MGLIFNASAEDQHFVVFGNHFNLKSGQIRNFEDKIAHFIQTERRYLGLVDLPEEFTDVAHKESEEGKSLLAEKRREGIDARVQHLRSVIYNNEVSLRQDLEKANIKADPKVFASKGEVAAYRELVKYQKTQDDEASAKVDELKSLEKQIKSGT